MIVSFLPVHEITYIERCVHTEIQFIYASSYRKYIIVYVSSIEVLY